MAFKIFGVCEPCCTPCGLPTGVPLCLTVLETAFPELSGARIPGVFDERRYTDNRGTYGVWSFYSKNRHGFPSVFTSCIPQTSHLIEMGCCHGSGGLGVYVGADLTPTFDSDSYYDGLPFSSPPDINPTVSKTCDDTGVDILGIVASPFELSGVIQPTVPSVRTVFKITANESVCETFQDCCSVDGTGTLIERDLFYNEVSSLPYNSTTREFSNGSLRIFCSGFQGYNWYYNNGSGNTPLTTLHKTDDVTRYQGGVLVSGNLTLDFQNDCPLIMTPNKVNGRVDRIITKEIPSDKVLFPEGLVSKNLFATLTVTSGNNCWSSVTIPLTFQGFSRFTSTGDETPDQDCFSALAGSGTERLYYGYAGSLLINQAGCGGSSPPIPNDAILKFYFGKNIDNGFPASTNCSGWFYLISCQSRSPCLGVTISSHSTCFTNFLSYITSSEPFYFSNEVSIANQECSFHGLNFGSACWRQVERLLVEVSD